MAVTSSLPITFTDLYNEFGGDPNNITLSDYLRGGGLVPDTATNSGVPTSLPVNLDDFLGATALLPNIVVELTGDGSNPVHESYYNGGGSVVSTGLRFTTTGRVQLVWTTVSGTGSSTQHSDEVGGWAQGFPINSSRGSEFEVRYAEYPNSYGSWLTLSQDRTLVHSTPLDGGSRLNTAQVREKDNTNNSDSGTFYLGLYY